MPFFLHQLKTSTIRIALVAMLVLGAVTAAHAQQDVRSSCDEIQGTIQADDDQLDDDATKATELARVTEDQAREAGLATFPDARITSVELDEEEGFLVYEVELVTDDQAYDVYVDAGSGEVLCTEHDD